MDDETRHSFIRLFEELEDGKFFGTLEFGIKSGRVYVIRQTRTILPEDLLKRELVET